LFPLKEEIDIPQHLSQAVAKIPELMTEDFVRMVHHSSTNRGFLASFLAITRALYNEVVSDKHEDLTARFGAALGRGFIDAGGRDVTISLQSRAESRNTSTIVSMMIIPPNADLKVSLDS
jgi:hypothetical protein